MGFFKDLFNDNNSINEKSVVGFASFLVMVIAMGVDLVTGWMGKELLINEYIFDGFMVIVLGAFGIASVDKWVNRKNPVQSEEKTEEKIEVDEIVADDHVCTAELVDEGVHLFFAVDAVSACGGRVGHCNGDAHVAFFVPAPDVLG